MVQAQPTPYKTEHSAYTALVVADKSRERSRADQQEVYWWLYPEVLKQLGWEAPTTSASSVAVDPRKAPADCNLATASELLVFSSPGEEALRGRLPLDRISNRNPEMVSAYLTRHPEVWRLLEAAWPALVRCFGGPVDIVLEVITYPEEKAHEELVAWVQSTDDVYEGLDKLERFDDEWFLDHLELAGDGVNFNIETK
jgi:hypothetical protein